MSLGLAPADFWSSTPREITAIQKGAAARIEREADHARRMAYAQAVLNREAWHAKKMPRFEDVFRPRQQRQTPTQIRSAMRGWAQALNGGKHGD